jgi:hypothetical protein
MYNINFLPHRYKEKKLYSVRRVIILFSICFLFIDIIFSIVIYSNIKSMNEINKSIEAIKEHNKTQATNSRIELTKKLSILNSYRDLIQYTKNNGEISIIDITDKETIMEVRADGEYSYINLIKIIEEDKKFSVRHVSVIDAVNNKPRFRIVLYRTQ